jgi:hypothetical protein
LSLQHRALMAARRVARLAGVDLVRANFYSPVPSRVPESVWRRRSPLRGIVFDLDQQLGWVREQVVVHREEFRPPVQLDGRTFQYANGYFGHGDADVLYGVLRTRKPAQVVELGSGHSSLVIRLALEQNGREGHRCSYRVFDPYPSEQLAGLGIAVERVPIQGLQETVLSSLRAGDVLFVDTTHTVKLGGDVVRLVLDLFPLLAAGVLVHVHDVPMPFEYDRDLIRNGNYWAEMYLVQAFLALNQAFAVRASLRALAVDRRAEFADLCPSILDGAPVSLWIERVRA